MKVTLQPSGLVIDVEPDECILDAARRLGFNVPHSCRNGNCQVCASLLLEGRVLQHGRELEHGEIFACISEPLTDCVLHWDGVLAPGKLPVGRTSCQLVSMTDMGGDVACVRLRTAAGRAPTWFAGQYLLLERADLSLAAFSIASAPQRGRELELHILVRDDKTRELLDFMRRTPVLRVELPFGDCHLGELPGHPLLLIAAGTGMAQMHSLVEHCLASGFKEAIHLYWGARTPQDFYKIPAWRDWADNPQIHLHRCVSDPAPSDQWDERKGTLAEVVLEDFTDFSNFKVFACGSPAMVYATFDALVEAGMAPEQMHADAFAYAPRD